MKNGQDDYLNKQLAKHAGIIKAGGRVDPMAEYEAKLREARGGQGSGEDSGARGKSSNPYDSGMSDKTAKYRGTEPMDRDDEEEDDRDDRDRDEEEDDNEPTPHGADDADDVDTGSDDDGDQAGADSDGGHMADLGRMASRIVCNGNLSNADKKSKLVQLLKLLPNDKGDDSEPDNEK